MNPLETLTLFSGSALSLTELPLVTIVPEVVDFVEDEEVLLVSTTGEELGYATVNKSKVVPFAMIQNYELKKATLPHFGSWPNALEFLTGLDPNFTQLDSVTLVYFTPSILPEAGLTATVQSKTETTEETPEVTEADLDTLTEELKGK